MTGNGSKQNPINSVVPAWDIACAYQAAFAITAAASRRNIDKIGAELRIALSDVAFSTLSHLGIAAEAELLNHDRPSIGNYLYGAFGKDFGTADKQRFYVAAISLNQWKNLIRACKIEDPIKSLELQTGLDFKLEEDRFEARESIAELVQKWAQPLTLNEVAKELDGAQVCWGKYQTACEAIANDARMSERNPIFQEIETAGIGKHLAAGSNIREINQPPNRVQSAPILGQHTDEILLDLLSISSAEAGRLYDKGIVAGPSSDPLIGNQIR
jgi:2-methylfumaryl-CoA isomerase